MSRGASAAGVRGALPFLLLLLRSLAAPGPTFGQEGIRIHEEGRTYAVAGSTAEEVWASLLEGARREGDDLTFAWTDVSTSYRSRASPVGGGCRIVGVEVDVRIGVTLPAWTPPRDAPLSLRRQWNRYEAAIRRHEEGHARRARETALRLRDALTGLAAPGCEALQELGRRTGERVLAAGRAEQERYDEETGHGRAQGVRWAIDGHRP